MNIVDKITILVKDPQFGTSVAASVLFFIVANPEVFKAVDKVLAPVFHGSGSVGQMLGVDQGLAGVHSIFFGILFYLFLKYIWGSILSRFSIVEGIGSVPPLAKPPTEEFIGSATFKGAKSGYSFKTGPKGTGYYLESDKNVG